MLQSVPLSVEVRAWIQQNLIAGGSTAAIVEAMVGQGLAADYAAAVVVRVRAEDAVLDSHGSPSCWHLSSGAVIDTTDRRVPVLTRVQRPRIALLSSVMSSEECEALIELARPRLQASTVIDPATGYDVVATYRGSEGMFFRLQETPLIECLDQRFSALMNQPLAHGEGLQVLRYRIGDSSAPHVDYLQPQTEAAQESIARSGQRVATLIIYLNDVPAGGETYFPSIGFVAQPHRGTGLYFEYCDASGICEPQSVHGGAAVTAGEKWVVTKWMRQRAFIPRTGKKLP